MNERYETWILDNVPDNPIGTCAGYTQLMLESFPELRRVRGQYHCPFQGRRPHWWLVAPDGSIVDPTVTQFSSLDGKYVEHVEGSPEPTGICLNCGEYVYDFQTFCSKDCARDFRLDAVGSLYPPMSEMFQAERQRALRQKQFWFGLCRWLSGSWLARPYWFWRWLREELRITRG